MEEPRHKLLLIDESRNEGRTHTEALRASGHRVEWARDGLKGLGAFLGGSHDLVVLRCGPSQSPARAFLSLYTSIGSTTPLLILGSWAPDPVRQPPSATIFHEPDLDQAGLIAVVDGLLEQDLPLEPQPVDSPADSRDLAPHWLADGRYELRHLLGRGGSATVYLGVDHLLNVDRAIKVFQFPIQLQTKARRRLRSEVRALSRIKHPNLLTIFDVGIDGARDFLVMELAERGNLASMLAQRGPFSPVRAVAHMLQTLSALAAVHRAGIVHRDIKPSNTLTDNAGRTLLADFGIALMLRPDQRLHRRNALLGSLEFMAPEQRMDPNAIDARADIYSCGATLYKLLTGESALDLFAAKASSPRWRAVEPRLLPILQRAMRFQPEERYPRALDMALDLLQAMDTMDESSLHPAAGLGRTALSLGAREKNLLADTLDEPGQLLAGTQAALDLLKAN